MFEPMAHFDKPSIGWNKLVKHFSSKTKVEILGKEMFEPMALFDKNQALAGTS
ncbi:hypothetical protein [Dyadobacter sp. CY351]|uniref:hypothetical protein n=1 Tax=Dyadobacter sp. CY351 TaxID=2909337 RepID=UPI001F165A21|nr:hypothetical protein [Dyadobacter sp. CY351]MCF2518607.1 hypothetical protein [Dyadobacter sp. CY351]